MVMIISDRVYRGRLGPLTQAGENDVVFGSMKIRPIKRCADENQGVGSIPWKHRHCAGTDVGECCPAKASSSMPKRRALGASA
jgi:hypothetical protein